jgi:hypothetical protein
MKRYYFVTFFILLSILFIHEIQAQSFPGNWLCDYATIDEQPNSTGYNTISVGVIKPNSFVALVTRFTNNTCYLVGYANADSVNGRKGYYGYGTSGIGGYRQGWINGFDNVQMQYACDVAVSPDSLIYVANNDALSNILVFKFRNDSIYSTEYRMETGGDSLYAIDLDASGRVYVTEINSGTTPSSILIFKSIATDVNWSGNHSSAPIRTITAPEPGELRGITVNPQGTVIYVSNYTTKKIYCYVGNPTAGYTLYNGFSFQLTETPIASNGTDTLKPGPWGLKFMKDKNILFVSCACNFQTGSGYEYSRIFLLNPNTGARLDTIDCALWNFQMTGSYSTRTNGTTPGNASGYASSYNVDFDNNYALYNQSNYGWTVDKWHYTQTLPIIPLTIVGVEKNENVIPGEFNLNQNYPNPFNPTTTIDFTIAQNSIINLSIYSISGELVSELIQSSSFDKGNYKLTFDASNLASGTYIYTLKAGEQQISKKMTLVK